MSKPIENLNEQFRKVPCLHLGRNTCSSCHKDFLVTEHPLTMPGTQDLESVYCPYCEAYNGEVFINGLARTTKIDSKTG